MLGEQFSEDDALQITHVARVLMIELVRELGPR
jgi:hypothetical protein